jgi:hypothetical protein
VRFHSPIDLDIRIDDLKREPALTLATAEAFSFVAPPVGLSAVIALLEGGVLDEVLSCIRKDPSLTLRITSYAVFLYAGELSSSRLDWHVDRIGAIRFEDGEEYWDGTDYSQARSFVSFAAFLPRGVESTRCSEHGVGTEFVTDPRKLELENGWQKNSFVQLLIRNALAGGFSTTTTADRQPAGFGARHIHRPGRAEVDGTRLFLRIGAYRNTEPCSLYQDHLPTAIPVTREGANRFWLRPLGGSTSEEPIGDWSLSGSRDYEAERYITNWGLASDKILGREFMRRLRARVDGVDI